MAETDYHITAIVLLMDALRYFFRNRSDVFVIAEADAGRIVRDLGAFTGA